jgi:predicted DNA-binding transcriptional regulator AlpA
VRTPLPAVMGVREIATLLGVSRQRADQIMREYGAPKPYADLAAGRVWKREDITRWLRKR